MDGMRKRVQIMKLDFGHVEFICMNDFFVKQFNGHSCGPLGCLKGMHCFGKINLNKATQAHYGNL